MKKTRLIIVMAALCLNYRISNDEFMKSKSITVRNCTITQLFTLALRLHSANDTSAEQANSKDQIMITARQPDKLNTLYY